METTIGIIGLILGLYRDNGKEEAVREDTTSAGAAALVEPVASRTPWYH